MNLREYLQQRSEMENARRDLRDNAHLSFATPQTAGEIIDFYRTYNGLKRQMRPLSAEQVETYLAKGYAFVGAYYDHQLAGIVASKQLPENLFYFMWDFVLIYLDFRIYFLLFFVDVFF